MRELVVYCTKCEKPIVSPMKEEYIVENSENHDGLMNLIAAIDEEDKHIFEHCDNGCHYGLFEIREKKLVNEYFYEEVDEL